MTLEQETMLEMLKTGGYDKPFTRDGKPKKWLALLVPLFHETRVKKLKLLNSSNPSITERNYKLKRGTHASTLASMVRAGLLRTEERGNGWWYKGRNWDFFVNNMVNEMMSHEILRSRFTDLLVRYESNAIDFFMKS
jgi:hypothetical protein